MIGVAMMALLLPPPLDEPTTKPSTVVSGMNRFAFDLFRAARSASTNVAISPASLSPAIAMVYEGAREATAEEIARVFHFPDDRTEMRVQFRALLRRWAGSGVDGPYRLVAANSLWGQRGYEFRAEYVQLMGRTYGALLQVADFRDDPETARKLINVWVDGMTNHLIPTLIGPGIIQNSTRLVLCNAIIFKAPWVRGFRGDRTHPAEFHVAPNKTVRVPTMHQGEELRYAEADGVQVVEMPYRGGDFAMVVILPKKADGLDAIEASFTVERLDGWLVKLAPRDVQLALPRFQAEASLDLAKTLAAMGMPKAFTMSADFTGISEDSPLWIGSVIHKAVVKVDEEGTVAAAATAVVMPAVPGPVHERKPPVEFKADHPFLYLIRDVKNGAILFLGHLVEPGP